MNRSAHGAPHYGRAGAFRRQGPKEHASGDWGDVSHGDAYENEYGLRHGLRVLSSHPLPSGTRVWIITEADRSSTTILLPHEY